MSLSSCSLANLPVLSFLDSIIPSKKIPFREGFSPFMVRVIDRQTDREDLGLRWFSIDRIRHGILRECCDYLKITPEEFLKDNGLTSCYVSSVVVFSIFAESSDFASRALIENVSLSILKADPYVKQGVDQLAKILELRDRCVIKRGLACLCKLEHATSKSYNVIHQFVIEVTPGGSLHFYQSYWKTYTLSDYWKSSVGTERKIKLFLRDLKIITSPEGPFKEKISAYQRLFVVNPLVHDTIALKVLGQLRLSFVPVFYTRQSMQRLKDRYDIQEKRFALLKGLYTICALSAGLLAGFCAWKKITELFSKTKIPQS